MLAIAVWPPTEGLAAAADQCAAAGLPLLVENEPGFGAQTGPDLVKLLADAGRDNLFVNLFIASELDWPERGIRLRQETDFPVEEGTTVAGLADLLGIDPKDAKLIFINGRKGALDSVLAEGDRVGLFPPVGGG